MRTQLMQMLVFICNGSLERPSFLQRIDLIQKYLKAGLLDEINLYLVNVLLGEGIRLFENIGTEQIELEKISVTDAPGITHLRFRAAR